MLVVLMTLTALAGPKKPAAPPPPVPQARIGDALSVDGTWEATPPPAPSPPWADTMLVDQAHKAVMLQWNPASKKADPDILVLPFAWIDHFALRTGNDDVADELAMVGTDGTSFLVARKGDTVNARKLLPTLTRRPVVDLPPTAPWPNYTPSSSRTPPQLGTGSVVIAHRKRTEPILSTVTPADRAARPPSYADDPIASALVGQSRGTVEPTWLASALAKGETALTACYASAQRKDAELQGEVRVRFVLGENGHVSAAAPQGGIGDADLQSCIVTTLSALSLPAPSGGVAVVDCPVELSLVAPE